MKRAEIDDIFTQALEAADPYRAVMKQVSLSDDTLSAGGAAYDLDRFTRIIVIGAGKGTALMAKAMEDILGDRIEQGIIIVKYGHGRPLKKIVQREAAHPLPDESGMRASPSRSENSVCRCRCVNIG